MGIGHDLLHACRMARRQGRFSAAIVAVVGVSLGLETAVFGLVHALLLRAPPVSRPSELAHVYASVPGDLLSHTPMAFPDYESLVERTRTFAGLAGYAWFPLALERGEGSELILGEVVTGNYFAVLGVAAARGLTLGPADDREDAPRRVVVLSDDGWRRHFAASPGALGGEVRLNGAPFRVIGVTPPGFRGLTPGLAPDLWVPLHAAVGLPTGVTLNLGGSTPGLSRTEDRAQRWLWVVGRLRPGATAAQAGREVATVALDLAREHPATNERRAFTAVSADHVRLLPGVDGALWAGSALLLGVFVSVLLLAAVNMASFFLARALRRRREIATRLAIGASRRQLVRQLCLEGLVLALAGGGLGLLLAGAANAALGRVGLPVTTVSWPLELVLAPSLDGSVLLFALGSAVLVTIVFALLPALAATRHSLAAALRDLGIAPTPSARRLRGTLVALQVAVSMLLLAGTGVALRTLLATMRVDPGFDPRGAAALTLAPALLGYPPAEVEAYFTRLEHRLREIQGVRGVTSTSHLPLTAAINVGTVAAAGGDTPGEPVDLASVGLAYFETMGIELIAGRTFAERDGAGAAPVAIVNQALARRLWPGGSPLGRRLGDGTEVVGLARDGKYRTLGEPPRPFLYRHLAQDPRGTRTIVVRTAGDPRPLMPAMLRVVAELDPRVPASGAQTLDATLGDALFLSRAAVGLLGAFALLALLLASLGIAWIVAYLAGERTREIGLRLALGASPAAILGWLLRRGLAPVFGGLAGGVVAAWMVGRALAGRLGAVETLDPTALAGAASLVAAAALAAAIGPVWVASRRDPATALRHE
jgi:predicted permease